MWIGIVIYTMALVFFPAQSLVPRGFWPFVAVIFGSAIAGKIIGLVLAGRRLRELVERIGETAERHSLSEGDT